MNERYQKQNEHAGKTRKSASSAKPKREAGSASSTSAKKAPVKKKTTWSDMVPSTPEIKKWRKIWYVLLVIALAGFGLAWWGQQIDNDVVAIVGFIIELGAVGVAIAIDLVVIRKLRTQAIKDRAAGRKGASNDTPKAGKDAS